MNREDRKRVIQISLKSLRRDVIHKTEECLSIGDSTEHDNLSSQGCERFSEWVIPYFDIIDAKENQGLGKANKDLIKAIETKYS